MNATVSENISAAKAGGLIVLVLAGWLAYQTLSGPAVTPAASSKEIIPPPSSLVRSGLRDYTDWEGLPEIFAIWADKAEWKDNRTRFAYWHPVMKTYSYFFEAVRVKGGYSFKEIAEPPTSDLEHYWDESLGEDCPIRFYRAFPLPKIAPFRIRPPNPPTTDPQVLKEEKQLAPINLPPSELKLQLPDLKQKR